MKSGGGWWVYLVLAVAAVGFGIFVVHLVHMAKENSAAMTDKHKSAHDLPVVIARARVGDMDQYLLGLGTVTPTATVTLKSRVDGEIKEIGFVEGQMVKQGDFLLQIDPRPYEAALKQAQGQLAKDMATQRGADWNVQQDTIALKDTGISQQQLITDTATRDSAAGAVLIDQANIEAAQLNLTYAHITSPITGRIGLRLVDLGNIVHATDTTGLAVITQLQPITVVFTLPEDNIEQIEKRMAGGQPLKVDAYDRDLTTKLASGNVLAIDTQVDPTTGTLKVKAQFDNKNMELFPNQFVNARMLVNTVHHAVLVPTAAIQHSPNSTFVYLVKPAPVEPSDTANAPPATQPGGKGAGGGGIHGIVTVKEVKVGPSQAGVGPDEEDTTVVLSGVNPGDILVTDGVDKLQDQMKVIARPAARTAAPTTQSSMKAGEMPTTQPGGQPGGHRRWKPTTPE